MSTAGKVWLNVWWSQSAKSGNEAKCRIYGGFVKMQVEFEAIREPKLAILIRCRRPHVVFNALCRLSIIYIMFRSEDRPLKLPLSCEIVEKAFFRLPICRGYTPTGFGHTFSNQQTTFHRIHRRQHATGNNCMSKPYHAYYHIQLTHF